MFKRNTIFLLVLAFALSQVISKTIWGSPHLQVTIEEGIEIVRNHEYPINENFRWNEITAAGIKVNKMKLNGFWQKCERLAADFGNFQIYADMEFTVMWVYVDPHSSETDAEAYYVQFP